MRSRAGAQLARIADVVPALQVLDRNVVPAGDDRQAFARPHAVRNPVGGDQARLQFLQFHGRLGVKRIDQQLVVARQTQFLARVDHVAPDIVAAAEHIGRNVVACRDGGQRVAFFDDDLVPLHQC